MAEKRVKVPFPTPISPPMDGSEVAVSVSTEKWSEVTLEDGTVCASSPVCFLRFAWMVNTIPREIQHI